MKKVLYAILCAVLCVTLCVGLTGCMTSGGVDIEPIAPVGTGQEGTVEPDKDPSVIFENEYCKQTVVTAGYDSDDSYVLGTTVENKTDETLSVEWRVCTVNGWVVDVWEWEDIMPNATIVLEIDYSSWDLEEAGITSVDELGFLVTIEAEDREWNEDILSAETYYYYPEGKSADEIDRFERKPQDSDIVVEDGDVTFIMENMELDEDGDWIIDCYFENNSDDFISYSVKDMVVDGWVVDSYGAVADMIPDSCSRDQLVVDKLVVEKSGIVDPTEIRFTVSKSDPVKYDTISEETIVVYTASEGLVDVQSPERVPVEGEVTVVDNEYLTMIVEECCEGEILGTDFNCYFQNNSDQKIQISIDEITADGEIYMAFWYQALGPGEKIWIPVGVSELEDFEDVEKFEFRIEVSDEDYDKLMLERVAYEP